MSELVASGRTILFVSHNLQLLPRLCHTAVMLEHGTVHRQGIANEVIAHYISSTLRVETDKLCAKPRSGDGRANPPMELLDGNREPLHVHTSGDDLIVRMEIDSSEDIADAALAIVISNLRGLRVVTSWTREANFHVRLRPGMQTVECRFHGLRLRPGHEFTVGLWMAAPDVVDFVRISALSQSPLQVWIAGSRPTRSKAWFCVITVGPWPIAPKRGYSTMRIVRFVAEKLSSLKRHYRYHAIYRKMPHAIP